MISKPVMVLATMLVALALLVAGCASDEDEGGQSGAQATATEGASQDQDADQGEDADKGEDADRGEDADKGEDGDSEAEREKEAEEAKGAAGKPCDEAGDLDGSPKQAVPADLPLPGDTKVYESEGPFGKTVRYLAVTDGDAEQLPQKRDDASDVLVENGYTLLSKDQEEGAEAEAHLNGKHTVDIQLIPLCEGKVRIRYTVS
jgi:hypothetical protein